MTRLEAYKAMLDGKKITNKQWANGIFCSYCERYGFQYSEGTREVIREKDGYEIYEEPKELYQVLLELPDGSMLVADTLYEKGGFRLEHSYKSVKYKKFDMTGWE